MSNEKISVKIERTILHGWRATVKSDDYFRSRQYFSSFKEANDWAEAEKASLVRHQSIQNR